MTLRRLGQTDLHIAPLVLGTNTAGWTADEATSFAIFDAFVDQGFTALDTADVYSRWVPGNDGESEKIIGRWPLPVRSSSCMAWCAAPGWH